MHGKRIKKSESAKELKKIISEILVANESDFRPYIEILNFTPENVTQSQFGSLLGVFEIKDDEEDSAYIVNFLSSVAKKEYITNIRKSPFECFESALNKINLALSEIAKHGNIQWMGKLDMALCALEGNNIHFSVSGKAHVLLMRGEKLTDISIGLSPEKKDLYPLKNFTDIASGKLEDNDKIIITTGDLFQILSLNEIQKGASQLSRRQFARFLKTALVNELEIAGTIVVDVNKKSQPQITPQEKRRIKKVPSLKNMNAFSEKTFRELTPTTSSKYSAQDEIKSELNLENKPKDQKEYIDKKTGHIYIHGECQRQATDGDKYNFYSSLLFTVKEETSNILHRIKIILKNRSIKFSDIILKSKKFFLETFYKLKERFSTSAINLKKIEKEEELERSVPVKLPIKTAGESLLNFFPNFSRIKKELWRMDYQQRIYAFLILVAIIVVPLIVFVKFKKESDIPSSENITWRDEEIVDEQLFSNDHNVKMVNSISFLYSHSDLIAPILDNNEKLFTVTERDVVEIRDDQKTKEFPMPSEWGNIISVTFMEDLNLIFMLTDKQKIVSFSPISKHFQENNIQFPENSNISSIAVYLTYIYLADSQANQIYRYPRAEGGFGEKTNWLRDNFELKDIFDMAIDGDIYLVVDDLLFRFSSGKKQEFNLEELTTPINFNRIFTNNKTEYIYILDSFIGRIVKFNKEGDSIAQYYNEKIKETKNFSVDEKNNKVYAVSNDGELFSFGL